MSPFATSPEPVSINEKLSLQKDAIIVPPFNVLALTTLDNSPFLLSGDGKGVLHLWHLEPDLHGSVEPEHHFQAHAAPITALTPLRSDWLPQVIEEHSWPDNQASRNSRFRRTPVLETDAPPEPEDARAGGPGRCCGIQLLGPKRKANLRHWLICSASEDGLVRIWRWRQSATREPGFPAFFVDLVTEWEAAGSVPVVACMECSDGHLAVALRDCPDVRLIDPSTATVKWVLYGHTGPVTAIAGCLDGRVVTGGADGAVRLWARRGRVEELEMKETLMKETLKRRSASKTSKASEASEGGDTDRPQAGVSTTAFFAHAQQSMGECVTLSVRVFVQRAERLPTPDPLTLPDPFVKVSIVEGDFSEGPSASTRTPAESSPKWDHECVLRIPCKKANGQWHFTGSYELDFEVVYCQRVLAEQFGETVVATWSVSADRIADDIASDTKGDGGPQKLYAPPGEGPYEDLDDATLSVSFSLRGKDHEDHLVCHIESAAGLPPMSVLQQCYVKVTARRGLRGVRHDCRIVEQSTEKVPFSMNPTFNQTLELEVPVYLSDQGLKHCMDLNVHIEVYNGDERSKLPSLGTVLIPLKEVLEMENDAIQPHKLQLSYAQQMAIKKKVGSQADPFGVYGAAIDDAAGVGVDLALAGVDQFLAGADTGLRKGAAGVLGAGRVEALQKTADETQEALQKSADEARTRANEALTTSRQALQRGASAVGAQSVLQRGSTAVGILSSASVRSLETSKSFLGTSPSRRLGSTSARLDVEAASAPTVYLGFHAILPCPSQLRCTVESAKGKFGDQKSSLAVRTRYVEGNPMLPQLTAVRTKTVMETNAPKWKEKCVLLVPPWLRKDFSKQRPASVQCGWEHAERPASRSAVICLDVYDDDKDEGRGSVGDFLGRAVIPFEIAEKAMDGGMPMKARSVPMITNNKVTVQVGFERGPGEDQMTVFVEGALDLPGADSGDVSDPFCVVSITELGTFQEPAEQSQVLFASGASKSSTPAVRASQNPVWKHAQVMDLPGRRGPGGSVATCPNWFLLFQVVDVASEAVERADGIKAREKTVLAQAAVPLTEILSELREEQKSNGDLLKSKLDGLRSKTGGPRAAGNADSAHVPIVKELPLMNMPKPGLVPELVFSEDSEKESIAKEARMQAKKRSLAALDETFGPGPTLALGAPSGFRGLSPKEGQLALVAAPQEETPQSGRDACKLPKLVVRFEVVSRWKGLNRSQRRPPVREMTRQSPVVGVVVHLSSIVAAHDDGNVFVWDSSTSAGCSSVPLHQFQAHRVSVSCLGYLAAHNSLVTTASMRDLESAGAVGDICLRVWNASTFEMRQTLQLEGGNSRCLAPLILPVPPGHDAHEEEHGALCLALGNDARQSRSIQLMRFADAV